MHQSNALVEFSQNILFLKMFEVIPGPNTHKNRVKIRLF
jgi:hypothetical protein